MAIYLTSYGLDVRYKEYMQSYKEILTLFQNKKVIIIPNAKLASEDRTNSQVAKEELIKHGIKAEIVDLDKQSILLDNDCALYFSGGEPKYLMDSILHSTYEFSNPFCRQEKNKIVWFSDQTCDLEDEGQTDRISRLTIEKVDDEIQLSVLNPFCVKNEIKRTQNLVAFSPGGNGSWSKSEERGVPFQTDIALLFTMGFQEDLSNEDGNMLLLMKQGK